MEKVTMFKSKDGKIYETEKYAIEADRVVELREKLSGIVERFFFSGISRDGLVGDIIENREDIAKAFRDYDRGGS